LSGAQLSAITINGVGAQIDSSGFVTPVPEPGTYAALAGAMALGFVAYRRRRKQSSPDTTVEPVSPA
jgi:hypothetical protein